MNKNKNEMTGLDAEIQALGINEYIKQTDIKLNNNKKYFKKKAIRMLLSFGVFLVGAAVTIITKIPWFIIGSICVFGAGFAVITLTDLDDEMKVFEPSEQNNTIFPDNFDKDESQISIEELGKKMSETRGEKYYTELYKNAIDEVKKISEKEPKEQKVALGLVDNSYYEKDEAISKVVSEVDLYYKTYKLPPFMVTAEEWKKLVDIMYESVAKEDYFNALIQLVKTTLADALVKESKNITFQDFVRNLCSVDYLDINEKEALKNKLNNATGDSTIVSFSDAKKAKDAENKK